MLGILLAKDLKRAWRNPIPLLINIALPICITALIAIAFGGKKQETTLGRIRLAIVDEDDSILTGMLRSAVTRRAALEHLDPLFVDRAEAMRLIGDSKVSGVVAIPTNFQHEYFAGTNAVRLELIKNPAQSVHPAVLDEAAGAIVTALDALARNFPWKGQEKIDFHRAAKAVEEIGRRFEKTNASYFAFVTYEKQEPGAKTTNAPAANIPSASKTPPSNGVSTTKAAAPLPLPPRKSEPDMGIFGYILTGMAAMFLLFIANNAMTDLQRELRFRTFERYQTLRQGLMPFIASKVCYALALLLICGAIMIGGGGLAFGVRWTQPAQLAALTLGYASFAAGLMAILSALIPGERRSSSLNDMTAMFLSLAGGCMFPVRQLPELLRDHISPLLPTYWYVETAREIQAGSTAISWGAAVAKLSALGLVLIVIATAVYRRRFRAGLRA